jgi:hypothetical protein
MKDADVEGNVKFITDKTNIGVKPKGLIPDFIRLDR